MKLALDTSALVYLLPQQNLTGEDAARAAGVHAIANPGDLDDDFELTIPAVVLTETLGFVPKAHRSAVLQLLSRQFEVLEFDILAGQISGDWHKRAIKFTLAKTSRQCVKWDVAVAATALRHGCDGVLTFDADFDKIVKRLGAALRVGPPALFLRQTPLALSGDANST